MNKLIAMLMLAGTAITMNSCTPEEEVLVTPDRSLVKTINTVSGSGTSTSNYTYDTNGRLTMYTSTSSEDISISYTSSSLTWNTHNPDGTIRNTEVVQLNAQGFAIYFDGANLTFNSDGNLLSEISTNTGGGSTLNTYVDGNLTLQVGEDASGSQLWSRTYTYLTDKLEYRDIGMKALYGIGSKNLVDTKTRTYSQSTDVRVTTYTYEYDSEERVAKETEYVSITGSNPSNSNYVSTYTYYE